MALTGRKPKPVAAKIAAGNPGKRPLRTAVPTPLPGVLPMPPTVAENPAAVEYWRLFVDFTAPGHLAPVDAPMLGRLCVALATADEATRRIAAEGMVVEAPNTGMPMQSPWLAIMNKQTELVRQLSVALALPPAERSRIAVAPPEVKGSVWDDI